MIIRLDWPGAALAPNRKNGKYWSVAHAAKVTARDSAYFATKQASGRFLDRGGPIPLSIVFVPPDARRRDLDGMLSSLKPALDGMAAALGADDSRFRPILIDVGKVSKPGAVIVAVGVSITTTGDI